MTAATSDQAAAQIEREKFEAWAVLERPDMSLHRVWGGYGYAEAAAAWASWQAARRELLARQVPDEVMTALRVAVHEYRHGAEGDWSIAFEELARAFDATVPLPAAPAPAAAGAEEEKHG